MSIRNLMSAGLSLSAVLHLCAAETVAKFASLEAGAKSGAFAVATADRTVSSPAAWPVSEGVTVVMDYSDFAVSEGDCAFISLKQSNKEQKNLIGLGAKDGKFYGIYNGAMWSSNPTGSDVPESGTLVFSYDNNGVVAYTVAEGVKTQVYAATGLQETGNDKYLGSSFDIGALNNNTLPANITVSRLVILQGATSADDVVAVATSTSEDLTLPAGTYTVSQVLSGTGALIADAGANGVITFGAANTFTGGLTVKSGTAVTATATGFGPNNWENLSNLALITVEADATLDLGNTKDTCYRIISQGGTITNSGAEIGTGSRQTVELALWDDSTVSGHTFGLLGPSYAETSLDMGKGVLTIDMASADEKFILCNTTITDEGTFRLNCGRLYLKKTIKGTLNIDLPEQPEIGTSVCTLDSEVDLAKATINVTVNGGALTADRAVDPLGRIVAVDPDSIVVKDMESGTWMADTTEGTYTFSELEIAELKVKGVTVTLKSENEANGATIDFGSFNGPQKAHYVIESGTHTIKWFNESQKANFDTNGRDVSPSILVKSGATLNLYAKDLTGWNNSANSTKGNVIKVEAGATLNLHKNGNNTWYYQGRLIIEPGATVHADDFESGKVRLNGGAGSDYQQLYVPASTGAETTAVYSAANGFRMASNATQGYAAFVGKDSVLEMKGNLATDGAYDFAKYGAGALKITGTVAANIRFVLGDGSLVVKGTTNVTLSDGDARVLSSETGADGYTTYTIRESAFDPATDKLATTAVLRISEIMPKPSDKPGEITTQAGYDANGLESGWVELENTSATEWANLADYKFIRVNRSKANSKGDYGNFPEVMIPPSTRYVFYTSERYANSADMTVSAWTTPDADGVHPKKYGVELHSMLVWPDKINPKKFPFTRLIYAPGGVETKIVDTVVIPSDIPEGYSIIVEDAVEGQATTRWMTAVPTKGGANATADLVRLGPNAGPLYEIAKGEKHDSASEFAVPTAPAWPGEDYVVTFALNPVMSPTVPAEFRAEDAIRNITMIVRKDLDNASRTNIVVDLTTKTTDAKDWGDKYTAKIPADYFPAAGHLLQWKFEVTDASGNVFTTPSFNNKDDGYEWYGTIVKPTDDQMSANLATWHMFVDAASKGQMDVDADKQTLKNNARVAIYDSSTSNYYDYVRIDLRGNTSASFNKKSHGLRFAKTHPLTMKDCVAGGEVKEIRKSSLIGEPADPSRMRQMMSFWLWKKMGNHVPFDFPVRCNLNGEFFQLGFHSERFTDELIEDVYGLDKFGYGYKNVGTLASGSGTTAGGIEKKTPDDGNESDVSVLESELRSRMKALGVEGGVENNAALTQFVVEKFDLAAWLNYLASARITQEMDDVWANISAYYDNAEMKEGARGTGTWMPLGYDFNLSLGQWYYNDVKGERIGLMANQDWFKSHPFYGGLKIRANGTGNWNRGIEAVLQSAKFRRLYLRRLRTLMDQELKEPGTAKEEIPLMAKMREIADLMRDDAALDCAKYPWSTSINNIDVWGKDKFPKTMDAGIEEIWTDYIQPRQTHFYVTHSVTNDVKTIGYGRDFNAGIPLAQSSLEVLKEGLTAEAVEGGVVIRNANAETIDLSGWEVSGPVVMKLPAGTVIDEGTAEKPGELFVVTDRRAYVAANKATLTDEVIVGNAKTGSGTDIGLTAADGTVVLSADVILPPGTYTNESYDVPVRLAPAGAFTFQGVKFNGGVTLGEGTFTLKNQNGYTNTAAVVEAPAANIVFTGKGAFELKGEKTSGTLMTVNDLIVSNGVFTVESKATTEGTEAVHLNGGFAVEDKGTVNLKLTKNAAQGRGFFLANKDKFCRLAGNGKFIAELNGPGCRAIQGDKGSVSLEIRDSAVVTATGSATDARYFKMKGNIKISGGTIELTATGAGTELLSSEKKVTVSGGELRLKSTDDCVSATTAIEVCGGTIVGTSTANDVLDSNGTITISGGTLVLLATAEGHEGLDSDPNPLDEVVHSITITGGIVYSLGGANCDLRLPDAGGQAYATRATDDAAGYVSVAAGETVHWFTKPAGGRMVLVSVPGMTGVPVEAAAWPEEAEVVLEGCYATSMAESVLEVVPGGASVTVTAATAEEAAAQVTVRAEVPEAAAGAVTPEDYVAYFKAQATPVEGVSGAFTVAAVLNPKTVPAPEIGVVDGRTAPLFVEADSDGQALVVGVVNAKPGLWYGLAASSELQETSFADDIPSFVLATSPTEQLTLTASPRADAAAFFRVRVVIAAPTPSSHPTPTP